MSDENIKKRIKKKCYSYEEKTDTETRLLYEHNIFIEKWKNSDLGLVGISKFCNNKKSFYEKERRFELVDNKIICTEKCKVCKERKPITPLYYHKTSNSNNLECESGKEMICNSSTHPCINCWKQRCIDNSKVKDEFIRTMLKDRKKLNRNWWHNTPNICVISNIELKEEHNVVNWKLSIQNNDPTTDHLPDNCVKIALEFNVREDKTIKNNLVETWKNEIWPLIIKEFIDESDTTDLVKELENKYLLTPKKSGVNEKSFEIVNGKKITRKDYINQCNKLHIKTILKEMVSRYINHDNISKREPESNKYLSKEILYNKLINQKMRCYYTGIPFSFNKDKWNFWSLERIDNNKNHTDENTVFICRIFNGKSQLNRKKILFALSKQIHVSLSDEIKLKIENELYD